MLVDLVHGFYGKIRVDPVIGPTLAEPDANSMSHLAKMAGFWS